MYKELIGILICLALLIGSMLFIVYSPEFDDFATSQMNVDSSGNERVPGSLTPF